MTEFNNNLYYTLGSGTYGVKHSVSVIRFPGGESNVNINSGGLEFDSPEAQLVEQVMLHARIRNGDDVMAVLLAKDAIHRVYSEAKVELFLPYMPYARQDRVCVAGEALSLKVMAQVINAASFASVTIVDPHSPVSVALLDRAYVWDQFDIFGSLKPSWASTYIVAPDMGASKKCDDFAKRVGAAGVVYCNKVRELSTGRIVSLDILGSHTDLKDRNLFVLDDICDGGRTFIELHKELVLQEPALIELGVTHGIFSNGIEALGMYDKVYTTNSFNADLESTGNVLVAPC